MFNDYYVALEMLEPKRVLFLAVPQDVWLRFFQKIVIQKAIARIQAKIIVYDPLTNEIKQWIK